MIAPSTSRVVQICKLAVLATNQFDVGASLQASAMPSLPVGSAAAMGGMLQVPGTLLAYQNLPHSPQLLPVQGVQHSMQAAPTSVKGPSSQSDAGGMPGASEEHDKMEQRRARRCASLTWQLSLLDSTLNSSNVAVHSQKQGPLAFSLVARTCP